MNLPEAFKLRMRALAEMDFEKFMAEYEKPSPLALRINTVKTDLVPECCTDKVPWCPSGRYYTGTPGKSPLHEAGAYYIQEPSAMAVAEAADIKAGERVLDLCAAPGGKSTHAACFNPSLLVSNEIVPSRAKVLAQNIERCGIECGIVTSEAPRTLADKWGETFDAVIADVPCSGEGMFRRREIAVEEWSEENCAKCAERSAEILHQAARMTRPGGRIIYSTCTFESAENECNVKNFLQNHPEFSLTSTPIDDIPGITRGIGGIGLRLYPHKVKGEGHFVCVMKKADGYSAPCKTQKLSVQKDAAKAFDAFAKKTLNRAVEYNLSVGNTLYCTPRDCPDLDGIKCLRFGLPLGDMERGRFTPHHSLALALRKEDVKNYIDLPSDGKSVLAYLHGETLPTELENGWALVLTDGISLGWGKVVNGVLKNFYPKGLRK